MAKSETPIERLVLGAGAIIRSNEQIMAKAYADNDAETLKVQREFFLNLKQVFDAYRQSDNRLFDIATSGYMNSDWLQGIERLVKKDENKPRGRKATVKADPATKC